MGPPTRQAGESVRPYIMVETHNKWTCRLTRLTWSLEKDEGTFPTFISPGLGLGLGSRKNVEKKVMLRSEAVPDSCSHLDLEVRMTQGTTSDCPSRHLPPVLSILFHLLYDHILINMYSTVEEGYSKELTK